MPVSQVTMNLKNKKSVLTLVGTDFTYAIILFNYNLLYFLLSICNTIPS